jgi:peptide-methionine (S)-S-oxide reductase
MAISKPARAAAGGLAGLLTIAVFMLYPLARTADAPMKLLPPAVDNPKATGTLQTAVLAGGCFWGVQGVFEHVRGVRRVLAGYAGGDQATAQYETVSSGATGHAESVQISFDPAVVSFGQILQVFFSVAHDPTQLNRQGPDSGTQYRSEIFFTDESQRQVAEAYIAQLNASHAFAHPIVTRVEALSGFYAAEDYHQDFLINNPSHPYIVYNDLPKIEHLQRVFPEFFRAQPVSVNASPVMVSAPVSP